MKMVIAGIAAATLAGAAFAQTVTPTDPTATTQNPMATSPTTGDTMSGPAAGSTMSSAPGTEVASLVERNGKWWNGDREATQQEIEAYKRTKKRSQPR